MGKGKGMNYLADFHAFSKGGDVLRISPTYAWILLIGFLGSIVSAILIVTSKREEAFFWYFLLPIGFCVFLGLTLFCNHHLYKKKVFLIFLGLYFLKLVVTPAVSAMGDWHTLAATTGINSYQSYLPSAIVLSAWEPILVGLALAIFTWLQWGRSVPSDFLRSRNLRFDGADVLILLGVLFIVGVLIYSPPLRVRFAWMAHVGTNQDVKPIVRSLSNFFSASGRDVPLGIIDTIMMMLFYVVRVLFPLMLLEKIYKKTWRWKKKAFVSLFIVLMGAQVTTEANGETILAATGLVLLLLMLYPKFYQKYGKWIIVLGMIAVVTLFALKVTGSYKKGAGNAMQAVSATMNAYMNGPVNLAIAMEAEKNYTSLMGIEEVFGGMPGIGRFFKSYQTSVIFNKSFWGKEGRTDQLLPSLGQGYMYVGTVFAPILQFLFIAWSLGFENLAERAESVKVKGYCMFMAVVTIFTIGINLSHVLGFFLKYFPGFIILYFARYRFRLLS